MAKLLEGIRVLDFGRFLAGPYSAMMLADFGADVIRLERREGGEDRWVAPVTETGEGSLFLNVNRNKRGVTLDPAHPMASAIIHRLIRSADIVIVNLPLDVMKKLRLDYDSLRESALWMTMGRLARRPADVVRKDLSGHKPRGVAREIVHQTFEFFGTIRKPFRARAPRVFDLWSRWQTPT